jgi:hypothetical protein
MNETDVQEILNAVLKAGQSANAQIQPKIDSLVEKVIAEEVQLAEEEGDSENAPEGSSN